MTSYNLNRALLINSTCTSCRSCTMQIGGNCATSGNDSGFCITIRLRAKHRLLRSNSSSKKRSYRHPAIVLSGSRFEYFWLFLTLKIWLSETHFATVGTSNWMWRPISGRFQKKHPAGAFNISRTDGANVCICEWVCVCPPAHKGLALKVNR
jgi:hypothetical protein